jgi:hypothetical protein
MKRLADYITESEQWIATPSEGDIFAIELPDEVLCETYIIEVVDDCILLDSTEEINCALAEWASLEDTDEGDSGVIMETMGYGSLVGEGSMKNLAIELEDYKNMSPQQFYASYGQRKDDWAMDNHDLLQKHNLHFVKRKSSMEDQGAGQVAAKAAAEAPVNTMGDIDEAEYQGRKVPLGKPMRGDTKKFKVYVKDPKTGNVKKVNFGHGGTTAKRLGQKTMKIKKSNPARRKSFRARHNCDNPGPRTKARYWSCRAW